jgi:elongator complex protein 1
LEGHTLSEKTAAADHAIVSTQYLSEKDSICLIFANGDIYLLHRSDAEGTMLDAECVGSVETGISAASWSPDEELLVLVTGNHQNEPCFLRGFADNDMHQTGADMLMLMTSDFEVLSENPLHTKEEGVGE